MRNFSGNEWLEWVETSGEIQAISSSLKSMGDYDAEVILKPDKIEYLSDALFRHEMNTSKLLEKLDELLEAKDD